MRQLTTFNAAKTIMNIITYEGRLKFQMNVVDVGKETDFYIIQVVLNVVTTSL